MVEEAPSAAAPAGGTKQPGCWWGKDTQRAAAGRSKHMRLLAARGATQPSFRWEKAAVLLVLPLSCRGGETWLPLVVVVRRRR